MSQIVIMGKERRMFMIEDKTNYQNPILYTGFSGKTKEARTEAGVHTLHCTGPCR